MTENIISSPTICESVDAKIEREAIVGFLYKIASNYEKSGMIDRAETLRWHIVSIENRDHWKQEKSK